MHPGWSPVSVSVLLPNIYASACNPAVDFLSSFPSWLPYTYLPPSSFLLLSFPPCISLLSHKSSDKVVRCLKAKVAVCFPLPCSSIAHTGCLLTMIEMAFPHSTRHKLKRTLVSSLTLLECFPSIYF